MLIRSGKRGVPTRAVINLWEYQELLPWVIASLYHRGYDEIDLKGLSPASIARCQDILRNEFIGLEIAQIYLDRVEIISVSDMVRREWDDVFNRLLDLQVSFAEAVGRLVRAGEALSEDYDAQINRYCDLLRRSINKNGHSRARTISEYALICYVEQVGDRLKELSRVLSGDAWVMGAGDAEGFIIPFYGRVERLLRSFRVLHERFTMKRAERFRDERMHLHETIESEGWRCGPILSSPLYALVRQIGDLLGPVIDINIEKVFVR